MSFTFLLALKGERFGARKVWRDTQRILTGTACKIWAVTFSGFWIWCSVKRPASFTSGWVWTETGLEWTQNFLKNAVEIVKKFLFSRQAFLFEISLKGKPLKNGCLFVLVETKLAKWQHTIVLSYLKFCFKGAFTCDDVMRWNFTLNNSNSIVSYRNFLNFVFRKKSQTF